MEYRFYFDKHQLSCNSYSKIITLLSAGFDQGLQCSSYMYIAGLNFVMLNDLNMFSQCPLLSFRVILICFEPCKYSTSLVIGKIKQWSSLIFPSQVRVYLKSS